MLGFNELGRKGWLGNQMFQYASTRGIATANGLNVVTPPADGTQPPEHDYGLWQTFEMVNAKPGYVDGPTLEVSFHFDGGIFESCPDNVNLTGFMQTEKYFAHIADEIKADFTFKPEFDIEGYDGDFISVHVRRGDYVTYSSMLHPTLPAEYYNAAIEAIGEDMPVVVSSDDIQWCMENIKAEAYSMSSREKDLNLMTKAAHNVISNSTFGWWGAWLGERGAVVAPATWFGPALAHLDTSDVVPERWIKLEY